MNVAVALLASGTSARLRANTRVVSVLQRLTGAIFVALGVRLALAK